jgi:hypothetical protein
MSLIERTALLALAAGSMTLMACTGDTASTSTGSADTCTSKADVKYIACDPSSLDPDASCLAGECATIPLETRVFNEWRAQAKALSGFSDAKMDERVKLAKIAHFGGDPAPVKVSLHYVFAIDWIRSAESALVVLPSSALTTPPTDAEITSAVELAIQSATWKDLAAIADTVSPRSATVAAVDACACGLTIDPCEIRFDPVSGNLLAEGRSLPDPTSGACTVAVVAVDRGKLDQCGVEMCVQH